MFACIALYTLISNAVYFVVAAELHRKCDVENSNNLNSISIVCAIATQMKLFLPSVCAVCVSAGSFSGLFLCAWKSMEILFDNSVRPEFL